MVKWRLVLTTLPFVALVVALVFVRDYVLHLKGLIEFSEISPFLTAVSLIIAFMLAGVLTDFKESEKIPGEIATSLETIGETVLVAISLSKESDVSDFAPKFHHLVSTVDDWFIENVCVDECYTALNDLTGILTRMHTAAGVSYSIRCLGEVHNLRRLITRADVIEHTSFLPVGYALLDLLVGSTLLLLLAANFKSVAAEYFLAALLPLIYIYLERLIRDLDQPFRYRSNKSISGSAEVNPYPLHDYRKRFEDSLIKKALQ